jgi:hypothetical protein
MNCACRMRGDLRDDHRAEADHEDEDDQSAHRASNTLAAVKNGLSGLLWQLMLPRQRGPDYLGTDAQGADSDAIIALDRSRRS